MRQGIEQQTNRTETQPQWGGPRRPVVVQNSCFACPGVTSRCHAQRARSAKLWKPPTEWGHFQRERPIAQLAHVLVLDKTGVVVRSLQVNSLVVMGMLPWWSWCEQPDTMCLTWCMNFNPTTKDHVASSANAARRAVVEVCLDRFTMGQN